MKNFLFIAAMLLVSMSIVANNSITIGDDVRIPPRYLDGYYKVEATMQVDGMLDDWQIIASYPQGVMVKLVAGIVPLEGMTIPYVDRFGAEQTYEAPLQVSAAYSTIASHIAVQGYWDYDNDGYYDPYGSAKWMPGEYQMFELNLYISPDFRSGDLIFDGTLTSGSDQRGAVLQGVKFYRIAHLWVGNLLGDVDSNDRVNISDVTVLINYLLTHDGLSEFEITAADFNQDGDITIADVTALTNYLLTH